MTPSVWDIVQQAMRSATQFCRLAASRSLRLRRDRLGEQYTIDQGGTYAIFRETVCADTVAGPGAVLVVGFRLRVIRANPALHWVFQRLCILTTPFWSGFRGFHVKLWMVDPTSKDYLGIYAWTGEANARAYVDALIRVLRPLSTHGSVWFALYPGQELEAYLQPRKHQRRVASPTGMGEPSPIGI